MATFKRKDARGKKFRSKVRILNTHRGKTDITNRKRAERRKAEEN